MSRPQPKNLVRIALLSLAVGLVGSAPLAQAGPGRAERSSSARLERQRSYHRLRQRNHFVRHLYGGRIVRDTRPEPRVRDRGLEPLDFTVVHPKPGHEYRGPGHDARIVEFRTPSTENHQGQPRWHGPGDTVKFDMAVKWGDGRAPPSDLPFEPAVHTNANFAPSFRDYPMTLDHVDGNVYHFTAEVPIWRVSNYRAVGVLTPRAGDERGVAIHWSGRDIAFRPYATRHDRLSISKVSIMNLGRDPARVGTFEDMMGKGSPDTNGRYTLEHLAAKGFTAVELNPIQPRHESPYSSTGFFEAWAEMSEPAQKVLRRIEHLRAKGASPRRLAALEEKATRLAVRSLKSYIDEAHSHGMEVYFDLVRNHSGKDLEINDVVFYDAQGKEMDIFDPAREGDAVAFSVRRNDIRQLIQYHGAQALSEKEAIRRLDAIAAADEPLSLQKVAPYMFGKENEPHGAPSPWEIEAGGWGQWPGGTDQLNTGSQMRKRNGQFLWQWDDMPETAQNRIVREYLRREMALWVLLGVDGFRYDHAQGTTTDEWDRGYGELQRIAWAYRRTNLYQNAEDWNTEARTKPRVDTLEAGSGRLMLKAQSPSDVRAVLDGWTGGDRERTVAGNHDEDYGNSSFNNHRAYAERLAVTELLGGPSLTKFGDERTQTGAHRYFMDPHVKPWTLTHSNDEVREADEYSAVARRAKRDLPALHGRAHDWLERTDGSWDGDILAAARFPDHDNGHLAFVFSNFNGARERSARFRITERAGHRLDDHAEYMAYSAGDMTFPHRDGGDRPLWDHPMTGAQIKAQGLFVKLGAYETQVLDMRVVRHEGGRWVPVKGAPAEPREVRGGVIRFNAARGGD